MNNIVTFLTIVNPPEIAHMQKTEKFTDKSAVSHTYKSSHNIAAK